MTPLTTPLPAQAKAILAGVIAGLSAMLPLLGDGFTYPDAITAAVAALVAYGAVFGVPNTDPHTSDPGDPDPASGGDPGDYDTGYEGRHQK